MFASQHRESYTDFRIDEVKDSYKFLRHEGPNGVPPRSSQSAITTCTSRCTAIGLESKVTAFCCSLR
ncbi:hypothetical protein CKAH01_02595 [Colletotrichum kahawae]|uniref:Uncharacterized protein n=1 Tax=Colletotrichum kahawae TaxID=34407 RepID=A0AAD9XWQ3_COLKA|nr:hypothetical protein CKAH01_02595 [Colletotrichum kahawae]